MPLYDYQNSEGKIITIKRSMKSKIPDKITRKGIIYNRVWTIPMVIMEPSRPKTLGAVGESNSRKKEKEFGPKPKKPKQRKVDTSLAKLTPAQKEKYIMTGKR